MAPNSEVCHVLWDTKSFFTQELTDFTSSFIISDMKAAMQLQCA